MVGVVGQIGFAGSLASARRERTGETPVPPVEAIGPTFGEHLHAQNLAWRRAERRAEAEMMPVLERRAGCARLGRLIDVIG